MQGLGRDTCKLKAKTKTRMTRAVLALICRVRLANNELLNMPPVDSLVDLLEAC